jgi:cell division protein FtsI (penicillin-binding protein 3)
LKTDRIFLGTSCLFFFFIAFAIYCVGFIIKTQLDTDLRKAEQKAREKIDVESIRRGDILSSDKQPLAAYLPEYVLYTDFKARQSKKKTINKNAVTNNQNVENPVLLDTARIHVYQEFAKSLSDAVGGLPENHYKMLYNYRIEAEKNPDTKNITKEILPNKIGVFQRDTIIKNPYLKKRGRYYTGIYANEEGGRIYPFGEDFAHSVIGVIRANGENLSGIESLNDSELKKGNSVITTIDTRMQDICETVLKNSILTDKRLVGGTIVLMEVSTGNIKAMANLGIYNKKEYTTNVHDVFNNATRATIDPGSTFKIISLMLALETGKVKISEKFNTKIWEKVTEKNILDSFATVSKIMERSSNVGTINMITKVFGKDVQKFIREIKKLNVIDRIEDLQEISPYIDISVPDNSMYYISHGYQMRMAPIHILSFFNAIANNGVMVKPRLVSGLKYNTGKEDIFKPQIINKSICSSATLDSVKLVLSRVVGQGSAMQIAGSPYGIAGKTGSAQIVDMDKKDMYSSETGKVLASFCGYFPEKNPQYSCIVVLYTKVLDKQIKERFFAGSTAVPAFREVSDKVYALYMDKFFIPGVGRIPEKPVNIPVVKNTRGKNLSIIAEELDLPVDVGALDWVKTDTVNNKLQTSELSVKKGLIPDVTGMGLRDAVFLLENKGLKVSYSGIGSVIKQIPEQGTPYTAGQKIILKLSSNRTGI